MEIEFVEYGKMVADSVHILVGVALVALVNRTDDAVPYLVAALTAAVPDVDLFLFTFVLPEASAPVFAHRGITHSLLVAVVVVTLFAPLGEWRAAALGYGSHLVADYLTGQVMLLAPASTDTYGVAFGWYTLSAVLGGAAIAVVLVTVVAFSRPDAVALVRRHVRLPLSSNELPRFPR